MVICVLAPARASQAGRTFLQECEHLIHALDKLLHFLCRAFMLDRVYTVLLKIIYSMCKELHF